ncbi:MAG: hypothetical protein ACJ76W_08640, partial [Chloroflexota bacterium]
MRFPRPLASRGASPTADLVVVPPDPRTIGVAPLDASLESIRSNLRPHLRRLWVRRIVRRAWIVVAVAVVAEVALFALGRFVPLEILPALALAIPVIGLAAMVALVAATRPRIGEAAIAVDAEAHLGDRVASALALAAAFPEFAGPASDDRTTGAATDEAAEAERFVRRQRADAAASLRLAASNLFRPRLSRQPAVTALAASILLVPLVLLPNPQDLAIAQDRSVRQEANEQAERIDEIAKDLETKGKDTQDPRSRLAEELRELARQLRQDPGDLEANLARVSSVESDVRSQLDPANEQRASSIASLSRALSRLATGKPEANNDGDPKAAADDVERLGDKLPQLSDTERRELASTLAGLQSMASQASGAAGAALREAAQSLAQGNTDAAREALDRLAEGLRGAQQNVGVNRDLARAASGLQDSRRQLADAGRQGDGQQATGQGQGQGQGRGSPRPSGPGQGQGQGQGQ